MADYTRQIQIKIIKVDGIEYCCTRPGYYYRKAAVGHERISQEEWEEALVWVSEMPEEESSKGVRSEKVSEAEAKENIEPDNFGVPSESTVPQEQVGEESAVQPVSDISPAAGEKSSEIPNKDTDHVPPEEDSSTDAFWDGYIF